MRRSLVVAIAVVLGGTAWASNELTELDVVAEPCGDVDGLEGVTDLALSPDDQHLYVTAASSGTLTVFDHDDVTGALTFNSRDVLGDFLSGVAISPDGTSVYVTDYYTIRTFSRDTGTGVLTLVEQDPGGDGARVSFDGEHVYVTDPANDQIRIFDRDTGTGSLTQTGVVQNGVDGVVGLESPRALALSPDDDHLYVAAGQLVVFERNATTGALTFVEAQSSVPASVLVSPDGAHVYATHSPAGISEVLAFERDAGTGALTLVEAESVGFLVRRMVMDPSGTHLYVESRAGGGAIEVLTRDAGTGELTHALSVTEAPGGVDGLTSFLSFAMSSDGSLLQVGSSLDSSVGTFARDAGTGDLAQTGLVVDPGKPLAIVVSPDGDHAYLRCDRSVRSFARDSSTGALSPIGSNRAFRLLPAGPLASGEPIAITPDGAHLYVNWSGWIETFERDPGTGLLTSVQGLGAAGNEVIVSPDGEHVYVSLDGSDPTLTLRVLDRDPLTGFLTDLQGTGIATHAQTLAISPDGGHIYQLITNHPTNLVGIYERDTVTGLATPAGTATLVESGRLGDVVVSPDGTTVYVGQEGNVVPAARITTLRRDQATGELSEAAVIENDDGEVQGLQGLVRLVADPAGTFVYSAANGSDAIGVFRRDTASGLLGFVGARADGVDGFDDLGDLYDLAISPDSAQLYAVAREDEAITVIGRSLACSPTPQTACVPSDRARLTAKDPGLDAQRALAWVWKAGAEPALGDPLTTAELALCVYDGSGGDQPIIDARVPPGGTCRSKPCWRAVKSGDRYVDKELTPDGVQKIKIAPKPGKTSKMVLKARGIQMPSFALPLTAPLTVQLQSSAGGCIESAFATIDLDDPLRLKAKAP